MKVGSFGSNIFSKLGQPARPQPTSRPLRAQNDRFSDKEPHYSLDASVKKRFHFFFNIFNDFYRFSGFSLRDESWDCPTFCPTCCPRFCPRFGADFTRDKFQRSDPPRTCPKKGPERYLTRENRRNPTLRSLFAPKSSKSTSYAYLSRRLWFKIVEIPSSRGRSKFLHAQNILQARLLNFRRTKIFDMRHEKF